jgi:hypothetical protein
MAPLINIRGLLTGVLTAVGTVVNDVADTTNTLVGSTLSVLGTNSAMNLGDFLTDNVRSAIVDPAPVHEILILIHYAAATRWISLGQENIQQHELLHGLSRHWRDAPLRLDSHQRYYCTRWCQRHRASGQWTISRANDRGQLG